MKNRDIDTVHDNYFRKIVDEGGGVWVGIQECDEMPYDLVLFNAPSGSTLAVKTSHCTKESVQQRLEQHESRNART